MLNKINNTLNSEYASSNVSGHWQQKRVAVFFLSSITSAPDLSKHLQRLNWSFLSFLHVVMVGWLSGFEWLIAGGFVWPGNFLSQDWVQVPVRISEISKTTFFIVFFVLCTWTSNSAMCVTVSHLIRQQDIR